MVVLHDGSKTEDEIGEREAQQECHKSWKCSEIAQTRRRQIARRSMASWSVHFRRLWISGIPAHSKHPIILNLLQVHSILENLLSGTVDIFVLCSYYHKL